MASAWKDCLDEKDDLGLMGGLDARDYLGVKDGSGYLASMGD